MGCQALGESGDSLRASASHSGGEGQFCRSKTVSFWTSKTISFNLLGPKLLETKPHLGPMMLYHKEKVYHKESVPPPAQEDRKGVFFYGMLFPMQAGRPMPWNSDASFRPLLRESSFTMQVSMLFWGARL